MISWWWLIPAFGVGILIGIAGMICAAIGLFDRWPFWWAR